MPEPALAAAAVPHVMGPICRACDRPALALLAARLGAAPGNLFIDHADVAVAHVFWFGAGDFGAFVAFVDDLVAPYDFLQAMQARVPGVGQGWGWG